MFFYLLLLAGICLYQIKFAKNQPDYMSPEQTDSIKGVYTAIILVSHMRQYIAPALIMDDVALRVLTDIGQLMVTMFLFYSGYGILCSAERKDHYGRTFFKKRIFKTWLHFAIAVFCYLILSLVIKVAYTPQDYLLCWFGWTSLGNSNWFVFVILAQYLMTWIFLLVTERLPKKGKLWVLTVSVTILSVGLWCFLRRAGKPVYWYNTLLCYPLGMWFFLAKPLFDKVNAKWFFRIVIWVVLLLAVRKLRGMSGQVVYSIYACVYSLSIVMFTTNVRMVNPILNWLGKHTFTIFIFQRIPMIIMQKMGLAQYNVLFMLVAVGVTLLLAVAFDWLFKKIDNIGMKKITTQ